MLSAHMPSESTTIEVAGHSVKLSNPSKVFFPERGTTKLDLVEYYLSVADAVLVHLRGEGVLPEARSRQCAGLAAHGGCALPQRATGSAAGR
jgi:DNA primase